MGWREFLAALIDRRSKRMERRTEGRGPHVEGFDRAPIAQGDRYSRNPIGEAIDLNVLDEEKVVGWRRLESNHTHFFQAGIECKNADIGADVP